MCRGGISSLFLILKLEGGIHMKKLFLILLMLGLLVPFFSYTSQHSIDTSNQVVKLDYDDDDLPEFVNFWTGGATHEISGT
jgi:hypothetical protein